MFKVRFIARSGGGLGRNIGEVALASKMASMPLRFSMGAWELLTWTVPLEQHLSAQNRRRFIDQDSSDPITEGASYAKSGGFREDTWFSVVSRQSPNSLLDYAQTNVRCLAIRS